MKRQMPRTKRYNKTNIIVNHIRKNLNLYFFSLVIFIIGIYIGVILVNNLSDKQTENIHSFISNSIFKLKNNADIPKFEILKKSISKNVIIVLIIWLLGLTFLGKYLLYILILVLGINFGYTLSCIMNSLQFMQGLLLLFTSTLLQNIIFIPSIIFLNIQGIKIHNELSIHHNIKQATIKFTAFCIIVTIVLILASIIETYASCNLLISIKKYL